MTALSPMSPTPDAVTLMPKTLVPKRAQQGPAWRQRVLRLASCLLSWGGGKAEGHYFTLTLSVPLADPRAHRLPDGGVWGRV